MKNKCAGWPASEVIAHPKIYEGNQIIKSHSFKNKFRRLSPFLRPNIFFLVRCYAPLTFLDFKPGTRDAQSLLHLQSS